MSVRDLARQLRPRPWTAFLALGVVLTIAYFLLPTNEDRDVFYQVPEMAAVVAIVVGVRMHRPANAMPWYLLALGLLLSTAGDWTWLVLERVYHLDPFPSVADVFYLGGMAVIGLALWRMLRGCLPDGDRAGLLDALIVAVGVALLTWVFVMAPIVSDTSQSPAALIVALLYPLIDILLLGALVRLVLAPGEKPMAMRLVIGALVAFLVADYPYALMVLNDSYAIGNPIDAGWLIGAALWGTAALHPSMARIARPLADAEPRFSATRLLLLAAASLMAPAVLVWEWANQTPLDVPVVAGGCVVLFLLVIARLQGVVADLRSTLDQRQVLESALQHRALHDPLTGLANRALFRDRLEHALARPTGSLAVMFIDLDDFKTVNDAYGHAAGDVVLDAVANALRSATRPEDTVARLGGDEFAVLLTDSPDRYTASLVAGRLLEAVHVPVEVAGYRHTPGASIGISLGSGAPSQSDRFMREADIAMYVAKGQGKGRYVVFEETEHHAVVRGIELRSDLEEAIERRQFELVYQPIIDLSSGAVAGVEALVRWHHPRLGVLQPKEFITLAEATSAIVPLGRWILVEACHAAVGWQVPFVSVNLSAVQLAERGFVEDVRNALRASGLRPEQLVLEVTETVRLDADAAAAAVAQLKHDGVRLAIDDFGTGYAGISQLAHTPYDIVKIDQSFVAAIHSDARADALVTGILDLARRLGIEAIAEGIEDGRQVARLRDSGCELGQGFHFARPMSRTELTAFLTDLPGSAAWPVLRRSPRSRPVADAG
ncbi:MAG TPA: EAL domain-containing protein [Candidatus Limnocylindria bacterium]